MILRLDFFAMIFYRFFHNGIVFFDSDQDLLAHQTKDVFRRIAFGLAHFHSEHVQCQNGAFWDFYFGHHRLAQLWIKLRLSASLTEVTSSRCFTLRVPDQSSQGTLGTVTLFSPWRPEQSPPTRQGLSRHGMNSGSEEGPSQ